MVRLPCPLWSHALLHDAKRFQDDAGCLFQAEITGVYDQVVKERIVPVRVEER